MFLSKTKDWPMLDVKALNPDLFDKIENLSSAHVSQPLKFLHAVIYIYVGYFMIKSCYVHFALSNDLIFIEATL